MTTTRPTVDPDPITTAFSLSSPGARSVSVALFFNRWSTGLPAAEPADGGESQYGDYQMVRQLVRLKQVKPGLWQGETPLAAGWHEYLFLVDGAWVMDPDATNVCPNDAGGFSAIRIVAPEPLPNLVRRPMTSVRRGSRSPALRRAS